MDPTCVPTAFGDRRNARILLEVSGGRIAVALFAKGDEETRGEDGTGAWERLKEGKVGRGRSQVRDSVVEVLNRLQGGTKLGHKGPDQADVRGDDPLIRRERAGAFDRLDAQGNDTGLHMVLAKEALQGGAACLLDRFEGWPLGEEVAEDGCVFVREP